MGSDTLGLAPILCIHGVTRLAIFLPFAIVRRELRIASVSSVLETRIKRIPKIFCFHSETRVTSGNTNGTVRCLSRETVRDFTTKSKSILADSSTSSMPSLRCGSRAFYFSARSNCIPLFSIRHSALLQKFERPATGLECLRLYGLFWNASASEILSFVIVLSRFDWKDITDCATELRG